MQSLGHWNFPGNLLLLFVCSSFQERRDLPQLCGDNQGLPTDVLVRRHEAGELGEHVDDHALWLHLVYEREVVDQAHGKIHLDEDFKRSGSCFSPVQFNRSEDDLQLLLRSLG